MSDTDLKELRYLCNLAIRKGHDNIGFDPSKILGLLDRIVELESQLETIRPTWAAPGIQRRPDAGMGYGSSVPPAGGVGQGSGSAISVWGVAIGGKTQT